MGSPGVDSITSRIAEVILTKRIWAAKPFLVAYVVIVGFTVGLLVNRAPEEPVLPVLGLSQGAPAPPIGEYETREPPLWLQLFRPSPATARLLLRTGIPHLAVADGSALSQENRNLLVYWTGRSAGKPLTLFETMLPFLRQNPPIVAEPPGELTPQARGKTPEPSPEPAGPPAAGSVELRPSTEGAGQSPPPKPETTAHKAVVNMGLPLVGIYHTHDWESYISEFPGLTPRTNDDLKAVSSNNHAKKTIVQIGNALAIHLRDEGITTVHAPFPHQELGYDYAYRLSRATVKEILKKAPTTRILLDLHRDGVMGVQTTAVIEGKKAAQIRCIIGDYQQPNREQNQAFCNALMKRLEKMYPGITLPTRVQNDTYNQDLLPGAILLEIGNALNQYDEAERSVYYLAKALAALIQDGDYPK